MSWQWYLRWIKPHFLGQPTLFLTNFSPFDHAWHLSIHVYVMTWKRFPLYWPFGRDSHRSPVDSHHKGPVMRNFEVFFVVSLIKKWNKQSSCLWCSCDITLMYSNNDCTLQWRHNGPDGDPNHWRLGCLPSVCSGADQREHQSSASLACVWKIHRWPVSSPHKGPVTRKMVPFDDVIILENN